MCEFLIGARADVNYADWRGDTALIKAASEISKDIVQLLLNAGANPFHVSIHGSCLLWPMRTWRSTNIAALPEDRVIAKEICELLIEKMLEPAEMQRQRTYTFLNCLKRNFPRGAYRIFCHVFKPHLLAFIKEETDKVLVLLNKGEPEARRLLIEKYFPQHQKL